MLVEFVGSTGAGKTTVLRLSKRLLSQVAPCTTVADLATGVLSSRPTANPTIQNVIQELVGLPFFLCSLRRHRAFLACMAMYLFRHSRPNLMAIRNLRSLERKLGTYTLARCLAGDRIALFDEGPLLAAHMFVYDGVTDGQIVAFVNAVPLPDLIVYVRAPIDDVVSRTQQRPDPPRQIASRPRRELVRLAEAADAIFENILTRLNGRVPILTVDNPGSDRNSRPVSADTIASFIIQHRLKSGSSPAAPIASPPKVVQDRIHAQ